jgi:hypothetical protein
MTQYVILLPGDESVWERASAEERARMYERHAEFARLLGERGHKITGGAELTHSRTARTVRRTGDTVTVTDGPYAEAAEQLTGFYLVESDRLDDLLDVVGMLARPDGGIEVRAAVPGPEEATG